MTAYADLLARLLVASFVIVPGLLAALAVARWVPASPVAKVWTLRIALLGALLAVVGIGIPVRVGEASSGSTLDLRWLSLGVGLYAAGVLTRLHGFWRARQAVRQIRREAAFADQAAWNVAGDAARRVGLGRTPPILRGRGCETVLVVAGRPVAVVLPEADLEPETLRLALAHEMAHIRHRDLPWGAVAALAECVLWFHPLIRLVVTRLRAWQEASADRAALAALEAPTRQYAEMLVGLATARSRVPALGATAASVREDVEDRLRALYGGRTARWGLIAAAAAALIAAAPMRPVPPAPASTVVSPIRRIAAPATNADAIGAAFAPIAAHP